jgi:hypothetical protein
LTVAAFDLEVVDATYTAFVVSDVDCFGIKIE